MSLALIEGIIERQSDFGFLFIKNLFPNSFPRDGWKLLKGLDVNSFVFERDYFILKISFIEEFYATMQMKSLYDIHTVLSPFKLAPSLYWISYKKPFIVSIFEKVEDIGGNTPFNIGAALALSHNKLKNIEVKKAHPWLGFYGEKEEFKILLNSIDNESIRTSSEYLLTRITQRPIGEHIQYIHRDVNPTNVLNTYSGVCLIDWDMAHGNYSIDDLAMAICCLSTLYEKDNLLGFYKEFVDGYNMYYESTSYSVDDTKLISAVALAGLRQAVAGWFTDKGDMSNKYWVNIQKRLEQTVELCHILN